MLKKAGIGLVLVVMAAGLFGCSTARRRPEVHSFQPAPVVVQQAPAVSSQSQEEMDRLKQQVADQQAELARAEADKQALEDKLSNALASRKPAAKKSEDSYLK